MESQRPVCEWHARRGVFTHPMRIFASWLSRPLTLPLYMASAAELKLFTAGEKERSQHSP